MPDLTVVLDPTYGERLEQVAELAPTWVVDTETNRATFERVWHNTTVSDHRTPGAVTSFKAENAQDRMVSLLEIMDQLEAHHGVVEGNYLHFPQGFVLQIVGLALDDRGETALREYGFEEFKPTREGFEARKVM